MPNPNRNLLMTDGGGASFGTRLANAARPIGLAVRRATNQIINNPVTPKPASTGGGSTRASASVSASSAAPAGGAVYDANAAYNNLINQMRSKAEEAYRNNVATINNAYGQGVANVNSNYDNTRAQLGASYDKSKGDINRDSEGSLQQAYINKMLTQRGLQQELSAQGLNGGAAESTLASLANNYGNSRNNIETTKASNLAELMATYQKNLADALNARNNSLASLEQRRASALQDAENQRANMYAGMISNGSISNLATADQSYLDALRQISGVQDAYKLNPTSASNLYQAANTTQAQSASDDNNYSKYLAQAQLDTEQGATPDQIKSSLYRQYNAGQMSMTTLSALLQQLGLL